MSNFRNRKAFSLSEKERMDAAASAALSGSLLPEVSLKHNGEALTSEKRDELLRKCAAGEYVELHLDVTAYEQQTGVRNRNFVRIADAGMEKFGKTGVGKPFIKDHEQRDSMSVGGIIEKCSTTMLAPGHYQVKQSVKLTAPWMVDLALRGLLNFVSISWMATGPVSCSYCNSTILTKCWHWPGDKFSLVEDKVGGGKKLQWNREGDIVIEWVYNSAEVIETSPVPVPAVTSAKVDGIRLSLGALHSVEDENRDLSDPDNVRNSPAPLENKKMEKTPLEIQLEAQVKRLQKLASFTDLERQFFNRISEDEKLSFLELSAADRTAALAPVYTATDGTVYNKSHDPSTVALAKQMDKQSKDLSEKLAKAETNELLARADSELSHIPGTREERAALLAAIDAVPEAQREYAKSFLTATETKAKKTFVRQGAGGDKKPVAKVLDAKAKLEALVDTYMSEKDEEDRDIAMGAVMETEEGLKLYSEIENEKTYRRLENQGVDPEELQAHRERNANN